jgi:hypothetical protein
LSTLANFLNSNGADIRGARVLAVIKITGVKKLTGVFYSLFRPIASRHVNDPRWPPGGESVIKTSSRASRVHFGSSFGNRRIVCEDFERRRQCPAGWAAFENKPQNAAVPRLKPTGIDSRHNDPVPSKGGTSMVHGQRFTESRFKYVDEQPKDGARPVNNRDGHISRRSGQG